MTAIEESTATNKGWASGLRVNLELRASHLFIVHPPKSAKIQSSK